MIKRLSLFLSLLVSTGAMAETVPGLIIGGSTKVPLSQIVSIRPDATAITVLKADGTTLTEPLATLTFGMVDQEEGIREVLSSSDGGWYAVYDLNGRLLKQGRAQRPADVLAGLEAGTYIVRMAGRSQKVMTDGTSGQVISVTSQAEADGPWDTFAPIVAAGDDDDEEFVPEPAMQIEQAGIDAMTTLATLDSLTLTADLASVNVVRSGAISTFALGDIRQISFPQSQACVTLQYSGSEVEGINPFYFDGVAITTVGAGVTVNSAYVLDEVEFELSGASSDGFFKYYGDKKFKATLKGLTLTNPNGPVINSQTGKKGTIKSQNGYTNTLSDGSEYAYSAEDQKGCIFSEGQLIFSGKGTLNILSNYKHAIASDDYVSFENGTVNVLSSVGDAVHTNDSILVQSGTVSLTCSGDGLDCDGPIFIRQGENGIPRLTISSDGDGAKGIKTAMDFTMTQGVVDITLTGNKKVEPNNTSNVIGIKADGNITITGGTVTITNTCTGGKYLSADGTITIGTDAKVIY